MAFTNAQLTASQTAVSGLYITMFGRAPERAGLDYWTTQASNGTTLSSISNAMFNVPDARATYPAGMSNTDLVTALYQNTLGRTPDAGGMAYWKAQLDGGKAPGQVFLDFSSAVQNYTGTDALGVASQATYAAKLALSLNYAMVLGSNDVLGSHFAFDTLAGTASTTVGTTGNDVATLPDGNITYVGNGGSDQVTTGSGHSVVLMGSGADRVTVGEGNSFVNAGDGDNVITAAVGVTTIITGSGNDIITTYTGNPLLPTPTGNDTISSGAGNDTIAAGAGDDILSGGAGTDTITISDGGRDYLVIGTAGDAPASAPDMINGFGKITVAVSTVDDFYMVDAKTFQAAGTAKGGADADVLQFAAPATGTGNATSYQASSLDAAYAGKSLIVTDSPEGRMTLTGSDTAAVDTLVKWVALANVMADQAGSVVEFEFAGNTYVFRQGGAAIADDLVQLTGVINVTGIELIGHSSSAVAGAIFVV